MKNFWNKVRKGSDDECWLWRAHTNEGYGQIRVHGKQHYAHRLAWELTYGEIPTGMCVCHKCDNPICVNPHHLFLGTHLDNVQDKVNKGRQSRHENHHSAKLTMEKAMEIRQKYIPCVYGLQMLAKEYGVHNTTIEQIVKNETWT